MRIPIGPPSSRDRDPARQGPVTQGRATGHPLCGRRPGLGDMEKLRPWPAVLTEFMVLADRQVVRPSGSDLGDPVVRILPGSPEVHPLVIPSNTDPGSAGKGFHQCD